MAKQIKTRLQNKTDTSANWTIAGNNGFIPLKGEMIVYLNDGFKIGDGTTNINNLPMYRNANAISSITVAANASDDDVVILTGTGGTNAVTYSASHADSGVTAGTYRSVTVNAKGHVTGGTNPTTLAGYGITDALASNTKYALSDTVGGNAVKSNTVSIVGRVTSSNTIFQVAAAVAVRTEEIWFGGSDAVAGGMPAAYCITVIKKGDNHRTILDCYHLSTGDHYINGCMDTRDTATYPWTGWVKQPSASDLNQVLINAKAYTDSKAITVDSALSTTSKNAVENQTITNWLADNVKQYYLAFSGVSQGHISLSSNTVSPTATTGPTDSNVVYTIETNVGDVYLGTLWENVYGVPTASVDSSGVVQLIDSVSSTSTAAAATPNSVKQAYDLAVTANEKVPLIPVTYSELVELRNNEQLVPGMFYRITNYQCTTVQENTRAINSCKFDIIVQALSSNVLSECAQAVAKNSLNVSIHFIMPSGEYEGPSYHITAIEYDYNNEEEYVPVLCENDDRVFYIGQYEFDDEIYDRWRVIEAETNDEGPFYTWDSLGQKYILTNVIVSNNQFNTNNIEDIEIFYSIYDDSKVAYDSTSNKIHNDTIVAVDYIENSDGALIPVMYKNDEGNYPGEIDYGDILEYTGQITYEGKEYNKWKFMAMTSGGTRVFYGYWYSDVIVDGNGRFIDSIFDNSASASSNINFNAWKLKYCLDNDTSRFAWTDEWSGKGVIYYMKDEWGNECPYDFKNIQFKRMISLNSGRLEYDPENGVDTWVYTFCGTSYNITNETWSDLKDGSLESPYGHQNDEGEYTFYNNIIKPYTIVYDADNEDNTKCGKLYLNDIVMLGYWYEIGTSNEDSLYYAYCCAYNTFGNNCHSNTFGESCQCNTFGNDCSYNTFDKYVQCNTFGDRCQGNTLDNGCMYNTFGNECYDNTLEKECQYNIFCGLFNRNILGISCYRNTFGMGCYNNKFGNYCSYNTFGGECSDNTFEYTCTENILKSKCSNNTFGYECKRNQLNNYCQNNNFGYGCHGNILEPQCLSNTFKNNCDNNYIAQDSRTNIFNDHCNSNILGTFCIDNVLGKNCDSNSFGHYCSNIIFGTSQSDTIGYIQNTNFASYCQYIHLTNAEVGSTTNVSRNTSILQGVTGTESAPLELEIYRNSTPIVYEANNTKHIILDI